MSGLRSIPNVKIMADMVKGFGRKGDTMLAHITPKEAALLKKRGGSGTTNPKTGLMEFWGGDDDDSPGTAGGGNGGDSVSGFGDHGSLGGGNYSESPGTSQGDGNDPGNNGLGFGNFADDRSMRAGAPESEISERDGGVNWNDYAMQNYKEAGTFGRLGQEIISPSQVTSRLGMPTAQQPGIFGPMLGLLGGPLMGLAIMGGAAMGRAQTPEEQQASMAEMQERGAKNSTGNDSPQAGATEGMSTGKMAGVSSVEPPPKPTGDIPEGWDEVGFLERNPEVKSAVSNGTWPSGYAFNKTYQQTSGVPYEQAMSTDRNDDLVNTRPGQVSPYKGY